MEDRFFFKFDDTETRFICALTIYLLKISECKLVSAF